ncbi:hypothetical protein ACQKWADRAFT_329559 [Trichoderma austrokoningii]
MASNETPCLHPQDILAAVSELGIGGTAPSLDEEFDGGQCRVYKLSFEDQESLAVRLPLHMRASRPDDVLSALRSELQTLQTLETKGFPWAPRCRGSSLTFDNPAEGSTPPWTDDFPPRPLRDKLLGQMAAIQVSLVECTRETGSATAAGFFGRLAENRRARVHKGMLPRLCEQDCADQKALLPRVLGSHACDEAVAMDHGDLKPDNVIVDADSNIICLIDWAFAGMVPRLRAAGPPRFLWEALASPAAEQDKRSYVAALASMRSQEAAYMLRVQTAQDVHYRTLFVESLFSAGAHVLLSSKGWKLPGCQLIEEVEDEDEPGPGDGRYKGGEAESVRFLSYRGAPY